MSAIFGMTLAIISALCWGGLDTLRKKLAIHLDALPLTWWLIVGQWPVFFLWVIWSGDSDFTSEWFLPGCLVSTLAIIAAIMFIKAVQLSPLSLVIPMLSFTPVFAVITSAIVLGEWPNIRQMLGILVIVSGALSLGWAGDSVGHRGWHEPGVWMVLIVSLCWAATLTFDKVALSYASVPMHALLQSILMGIGLLVILSIRGSLSELKKITQHKKLYIWAIIMSCLATGTQLMAISAIQVGIVEAIKRSFGLTLSVLNGWIFFGEPPTLMKQISILWMGGGVIIIVL